MSVAANGQSWEAIDAPVRVECSALALDQIASAARDGFRQFRHGGMEVGGILIGSRQDNVIRIVDTRPVSIEYGRGPYFLLTDADNDSLHELLETVNREVRHKRLQVVGYYESHTRRGVSLEETNLEAFDAHFGATPAVCIVVKPLRDQAPLTAIYIRDQAGNISATQPVENREALDFYRDDAVAQPDDASVVAPPPAPVAALIPPIPERATFQPPKQFGRNAVIQGRNRWLFAAPLLALIVLAFLMWRALAPSGDGRSPGVPVATPVPSAAPVVPNPEPAPPQPPEIANKEPVAKAKTSKKRSSRARRGRRAQTPTVTR
jgi:hypothetical protein